MRAFWIVGVPLLVQLAAYAVVFVAASSGGSFMGLFAMPVSALSLAALLTHGYIGWRDPGPVWPPLLRGLAIAIGPPVLLLIFRALES